MPAVANADTGSEVNLVSERLVDASRLGTMGLISTDIVQAIEFADGETVRLRKKVNMAITLPEAAVAVANSSQESNEIPLIRAGIVAVSQLHEQKLRCCRRSTSSIIVAMT
jgi:hypothetical protein